MKINGVGSSQIINMYSNNKKAESTNVKKIENHKDSLEISSAGRSLSAMSSDKEYINSTEKIEALRKAVSQGTYKPNAQGTAKKMIEMIKERDI